MMPFSVLRMWGLGLFGWIVLGLGIYLAWQSYREFDRASDARVARQREIEAAERNPDLADRQRLSPPPQAAERRAWQYLAAAATLLALSFGGFLPVRLL